MARLLRVSVAVSMCLAAHAVRAAPDESDLRLRVANAELKRADGIPDLVDLATHGSSAQRVLALRGLGRVGGPVNGAKIPSRVLDTLNAALRDPAPEIVGAAAAALAVAASLDDVDLGVDDALLAALPNAGERAPSVIEALGVAGSVATQPALIAALAEPKQAEVAALALGRHGRRTIALGADARAALVKATASPDAAVRYASSYALAREAKPPEDAAVISALAARLSDSTPEVRSVAISALGKRKAYATVARPERALFDRDFRVAVEAVRALAGGEEGRDLIATALALRFGELAGGGNPSLAQFVLEAETALAPAANRPVVATALRSIIGAARRARPLPALTRGWVECLATAALLRAQAEPDYAALQHCGEGELADGLRLPLVAELINANVGSLETRRAALAGLSSHPDARVRAAGISALAAFYAAGEDADRATAISSLVSALSAPEFVIIGAALEAAPQLYDAIGDADHSAIDAALLARAATERDGEIGAGVLELVGQRALAEGAASCRSALQGAPVLAIAALHCLSALGESVPDREAFAALAPPPVDPAAVIGKSLRWHLATTRGEIVIALRPEIAPWTVATIVSLTQKGFYDDIAFHRVVADFVVQGGDPTETGYGGPGFSIPSEPATNADAPGFRRGGLGIADAGRDSGGSQFFIMHGRAPYLDARYSYFGEVERGQSVAEAWLVGDRILRATIER